MGLIFHQAILKMRIFVCKQTKFIFNFLIYAQTNSARLLFLLATFAADVAHCISIPGTLSGKQTSL